MTHETTTFAVFSHGTFWGTFEAQNAEDAMQIAANEHGTIDVGQTQASTDGMTAKLASECTNDEMTVA